MGFLGFLKPNSTALCTTLHLVRPAYWCLDEQQPADDECRHVFYGSLCMWNKTLHVDEVDVVDAVDSSTPLLCLYIMQNYAVNFGGIQKLKLSFLYLVFFCFFCWRFLGLFLKVQWQHYCLFICSTSGMFDREEWNSSELHKNMASVCTHTHIYRHTHINVLVWINLR